MKVKDEATGKVVICFQISIFEPLKTTEKKYYKKLEAL